MSPLLTPSGEIVVQDRRYLVQRQGKTGEVDSERLIQNADAGVMGPPAARYRASPDGMYIMAPQGYQDDNVYQYKWVQHSPTGLPILV